MSKAFVRESDFPEIPEPVRMVPRLPPGAKNLITPEGAEKLRFDLTHAIEIERPPLLAMSDVEARGELQKLDEKIRYLQQALSSAEIVDQESNSSGVVRFGGKVTIRERDGTTETYRIVGVDETDFFPESISWQSPLARALINAKQGQTVSFHAPAGLRKLEILKVE